MTLSLARLQHGGNNDSVILSCRENVTEQGSAQSCCVGDAFPLPPAELGHAPSTRTAVLSPTVTVSCCWLVTDAGVGAAELGTNDNTEKNPPLALQLSTEVSGNASNMSACKL